MDVGVWVRSRHGIRRVWWGQGAGDHEEVLPHSFCLSLQISNPVMIVGRLLLFRGGFVGSLFGKLAAHSI